MGEYTPTVEAFRGVYGQMCAEWCRDDALAEFDRFIARVKAEAVAGARKELVDLREENDRLERILQTPLSLKDLQVAWENAEQAKECRAGDVLIIQDDEDNYVVRRMDDRSDLDGTARILSRAPKPREPWQDLADVIGEHTYEPDPKWLAQALYQSGVRVTDGGE